MLCDPALRLLELPYRGVGGPVTAPRQSAGQTGRARSLSRTRKSVPHAADVAQTPELGALPFAPAVAKL